MIYKKSFTVLILAVLCTFLSSHDFWLDPGRFIYEQGDKINIRFLTGENFTGEVWKGSKEEIESIRLYFGGVSDDVSDLINDNTGDSLELIMLDQGTCMVTLISNRTYQEIPAQDFNQYLQKEGLFDILQNRKEREETDSTGIEFYQQCAKTIFQVGRSRDKTYGINTPMILDMIPQSNPYLLNDGDTLLVSVLLNNEPLTGSQVRIGHQINDSTTWITATTDEKGFVKFPVLTSGKWILSTVTMEEKIQELNGQKTRHWQSYRGSVTWGYY